MDINMQMTDEEWKLELEIRTFERWFWKCVKRVLLWSKMRTDSKPQHLALLHPLEQAVLPDCQGWAEVQEKVVADPA